MIYFDHAATMLPKPPSVGRAMVEAMESCGNPARGAHGPSLRGARLLFQARTELAALFGAADPARMCFASGATQALNTAIGALDGHIVTTAAEHNSVLRPVHRRGNYTVVPVDGAGRLDLDCLERAIRPATRAVVMTHASNVTGTVYDIAEAGALCRRRGLLFVVDAAQTAGLLPIRVDDWGISALCFSGHKSLCGPTGTGGLCLGPDFRPPPPMVGGSGTDSFSEVHPAALPDALEAGTQNVHGVAGLLAGLEHQRGLEQPAHAQSLALADRFLRGLERIPGVSVYGDHSAAVRVPVVSLNLQNFDAAEVADRLWTRYEIAVRAGAHCAPRMHMALGTQRGGAVRFSFSHQNTAAEIDRALAALDEIRRQAEEGINR